MKGVTDALIIRLAERPLETLFGTWREVLYFDGLAQSLAIVYGRVEGEEAVPCRVHSACLSAHVFNSAECDCRDQMALAQEFIQSQGQGVVIWLDQDGRGHGHLALMRAARLAAEESISQTAAYVRLGYSGDNRRYGVAAEILRDLGVCSVQLLTDSPGKAQGLTQNGVAVSGVKSVAVDIRVYPQLEKYYVDKLNRGYTLDLEGKAP